MERVKVYTTDDCFKCDLTKQKFDEKGVEYESIPLTDETAAEFREQGYSSAPVVVTENETWAGLRPDKIRELGKIAMQERNELHGGE